MPKINKGKYNKIMNRLMELNANELQTRIDIYEIEEVDINDLRELMEDYPDNIYIQLRGLVGEKFDEKVSDYVPSWVSTKGYFDNLNEAIKDLTDIDNKPSCVPFEEILEFSAFIMVE